MSYKAQIYRFWTEFKPDPNDAAKLVGHDYVEYGPVGLGDRVRNVEKVSRLAAVRPRDPNDGGMDKALTEANDRWDYIRPLYQAWKSGHEAPETGTPLAAWNAITPEMAEILKMRTIKTVEDIAGMTDSVMQQIPLPGLRRLADDAKLFLSARDQTRFAADFARKDEELAALRAEMAEMRELFKANDKTGALEPMTPKRRGRPPKVKEPAQEEAA